MGMILLKFSWLSSVPLLPHKKDQMTLLLRLRKHFLSLLNHYTMTTTTTTAISDAATLYQIHISSLRFPSVRDGRWRPGPSGGAGAAGERNLPGGGCAVRSKVLVGV